MSRLQQGLKTRQTRFALALKVALLGGVVAFSSAVFAEGLLKEGITPATEASQIPASAKLRTDTVVAGISEPQGIFNPYFFVNGWDENVTNVIFSRLIDWDSQGKLVPGLAESWTVSPDNKVYTIKLRPGLTFSDGSPLTAEDVAFTLTVLLDPSYDGDTDITLANIAGGADYKAGKADSVSGLKVIDPLLTVTENLLLYRQSQPGVAAPLPVGLRYSVSPFPAPQTAGKYSSNISDKLF